MTCRSRPARWVVGRRLVCSVALRSHRGGDLPLRASAGIRQCLWPARKIACFQGDAPSRANDIDSIKQKVSLEERWECQPRLYKRSRWSSLVPMWMNRSGPEMLTHEPLLVGWKAAATLRLRSSSPTAQTSRSTGRWLRPTRAAPPRPTTRRRPAPRSLPAIEDSHRARIAPLQGYRISAYSATFQMKVRSTVSLGSPHWAKSRTIELTFSLDI